MMLDYKDTADSTDDRPYYFTLDPMYNVRRVIDRAGAIIERYAYDPYGRPLIREAPGRGDMDDDNLVDGADGSRFTAAKGGTIWDARADMDDDGDIDSADQSLFTNKRRSTWPPFMQFPPPPDPTVAQAFSDVNNPFMFQGRPHFALDTGASATVGKMMINDHRARPEGPVIGRWLTRDPRDYNPMRRNGQQPLRPHKDGMNIYQFVRSVPTLLRDPLGNCSWWPVLLGESKWIDANNFESARQARDCWPAQAFCTALNNEPGYWCWCGYCSGSCAGSKCCQRFTVLVGEPGSQDLRDDCVCR